MDSESSMESGALQADPDTVRDRDPLRIARAALETMLKAIYFN